MKVAIIYWSATGNTRIMAQSIGKGLKSAGTECNLIPVSEAKESTIDEHEMIAFGCPSMGTEMLEEIEFDPYFTKIESKLKNKKVALFGSYSWGNGEWMRDWEKRVIVDNAHLFEEGLTINDTPDEDGIKSCIDYGERFSKF
ncbi:MAG: flavodoxin [Synergistaceae bacterium]